MYPPIPSELLQAAAEMVVLLFSAVAAVLSWLFFVRA